MIMSEEQKYNPGGKKTSFLTKHSKAGKLFRKGKLKRYLKRKKTQPVYFKTARRTSNVERLKKAGLSKEDLRSLGYGK